MEKKMVRTIGAILQVKGHEAIVGTRTLRGTGRPGILLFAEAHENNKSYLQWHVNLTKMRLRDYKEALTMVS
jgi:hypothetical protein